MNPWKPTKVEWITYFCLAPILTFFLNMLLFGDRIFVDKDVWIYSAPVLMIISFASWYLHVTAMHWYRLKLPELKWRYLWLSHSHL